MARRELTVQRHEEIKRRLAESRSVREIASALSCSPVGARDPRWRASDARDGARCGSVVDVAARMARDHPRTRTWLSTEVHLGGCVMNA
jgi:hypothetical protein